MPDKTIADWLQGKSPHTIELFNHFTKAFQSVGPIELHSATTMIGISNMHKRVAWVTQLGKNFIHIVFPFARPHTDNLCFIKIAQVPGDAHQFNHHLRMLFTTDINEEVLYYIKLAYDETG